MEGQSLTITEVAKALDTSTRTVRRWLKEGKLQATLERGKFGMEYRIASVPPHLSKGTKHHIVGDRTLMDMVSHLQRENMRLAHELGRSEERVLTLEGQVKLLTAPKLTWWRRIARRG